MTGKDTAFSISDTRTPNTGRVYDYILGGYHNFEVDRKAAEQLLAVLPGFSKLARLIRWFVGVAVESAGADGYARYIDFASGLPTGDHIHRTAPKGSKVVYSDMDPVTVSYGREIIKDESNAAYFTCNFVTPENLLELPMVLDHLEGSRKVVYGVSGVAWLVTDDQLRHAMGVLYDWAEKGSRLIICDADIDARATDTLPEATRLFEDSRQPFHIRSNDTLREIIGRWKIREPGFRTLEEWSGLKGGVTDQTLSDLGGRFVGAILEK